MPTSGHWSGSLRGTDYPFPQNYTRTARWELVPAPPCMRALARLQGCAECPACTTSAPGTRSFLRLEKQAVSSSAPWRAPEGCTGASATSTAS